MYGLIDIDHPNYAPYTDFLDVGDMLGERYLPHLTPFPASHRTRANRPIHHFEGGHLRGYGTYDIAYGVPSHGNAADPANRLWDNAYGLWGYTKVDMNASIDISMNCHGFSTGLNTWVVGMGTWLADEYEHTRRRDHLAPGAIFYDPNWIPLVVHINGADTLVNWVGSHSSRIDGVHLIAGTHDKTVTVVEKNRESALYTKTFTM